MCDIASLKQDAFYQLLARDTFLGMTLYRIGKQPAHTLSLIQLESNS